MKTNQLLKLAFAAALFAVVATCVCLAVRKSGSKATTSHPSDPAGLAQKATPSHPSDPVELARNGETAAIRAEAIRGLPLGVHDAMLAKIAWDDPFGMVRYEAVRKLADEDALAEIAASQDEPFIRAEATKKVADKALLGKLASDPAVLVARAARERLGQ